MPIPVILAETFRSLSACRRASEERFIGIRGYTKARQHFRGRVDGNSPESPKRRH
ncbi:hypothetical protein Gotri_019426 [Gossypium trilobum]|uniref:Uncharacterized protein n=1 Tax=Gossypium trilobum TaxID=34281 RepID=A0A7J9ECW2_9ROSI|nr:hypothetical protein [Gossypium trilobum]